MGYDRATLIPTGFLSLLPLHAAWTEDSSRPTGKRYAIDDIHFTYTPNAKSLTEARKIADRIQANSILAIDNPTGDKELKNSKREIDCAIDSFRDRTVLRHDNATIDAVKSGLAKAAIVHFSCHGTANFTEPLNSGLLMSDGLLTLKDLFALNLTDRGGLRIAILSACETGLPGLDNIDEVVSLPIGLMQAGVAGVISTLWSVSDLSTMIFLTRFYHLWRKEGLEPSMISDRSATNALHQAQQWMSRTTDGEKADYCGLTILKSQRDKYTYAHPFHWAAFNYLGV
jgi:CHAT domain-containing protein